MALMLCADTDEMDISDLLLQQNLDKDYAKIYLPVLSWEIALAN